MTFDSIRNDILEKNYSVVSIALPKPHLDEAVESFFEFLKLPLETKNQLFFRVNPESKYTGVGYVRRHKEIANSENKEYFHYHYSAKERFADLAHNNPAVQNLLSKAEKVYEAGAITMRYVMGAIDKKAPGVLDKFFPPGQKPALFLRFLKYDPKGVGDFLAEAHFDTGDVGGGATLAIAESSSGLRIGKGPEDLKEVPPRKEGTTLFMPAMRLSDMDPSLKDFTPTWHDVIQKSENVYSPGVARWAVVLFANSLPI
jgi:isopenicillin N synthase-like dioxygenase